MHLALFVLCKRLFLRKASGDILQGLGYFTIFLQNIEISRNMFGAKTRALVWAQVNIPSVYASKHTMLAAM